MFANEFLFEVVMKKLKKTLLILSKSNKNSIKNSNLSFCMINAQIETFE